jgi:hypothetical protein
MKDQDGNWSCAIFPCPGCSRCDAEIFFKLQRIIDSQQSYADAELVEACDDAARIRESRIMMGEEE